MTRDALEPLSAEAILKNLKDRLEAFDVAFRRGPADAQQVMDIWEKTLQLKGECEKFYRFLLDYWTVVNGLLWAHYPEEYRERIYPRIQEAWSLENPLPNAGDLAARRQKPRTMLDVVEEIYLSRNNEPLSISDLVTEMEKIGVRFKAKEPAKSLAQTMRNSGRFEIVKRGIYRLKQ